MKKLKTFSEESTFDLAFGLATSKFTEREKLIVLEVIHKRGQEILESESKVKGLAQNIITSHPVEVRTFKKGSKSEKINQLFHAGKTPKQIYDSMNKIKQTVYYPEIYRIKKLRENKN